jgi:hypothetical protein
MAPLRLVRAAEATRIFGADGDPHAAKAGDERADGAEDEGDGHADCKCGIAFAEIVAQVNNDGEDDREHDDGLILPLEKRFGSRLDGVRYPLHFRSAIVLTDDVLREKYGHQKGKDTDGKSDQKIVLAGVGSVIDL